MTKIALELFAGRRSFGKVAEKYGFHVFSLEIDPRHECNITQDILDFHPENFDFVPDVIWASPVCTSFSIASNGFHRDSSGQAKTETWILGEKLVIKTLEIIEYYEKKNSQIVWFLENPRGMLQKMDFMKHLERHKRTITYCQYGHSCMKPTNIWTNLETWTPRKMCSPGSKCHIPAPRGSHGGLVGNFHNSMTRSLVPSDLFEELLTIVTWKTVKYH